MRNLGFQELLVLIPFVGVIVAIWVSLKARPLGDKPYRWGTWVGILHGLIFLSGFVEGPEWLLIGFPFALVSVGLLNRRRYGVVVFLLVQVAILVFGVLYFVAGFAHPTASDQEGRVLAVIALFTLLAINSIYFKNRWKLMRSEYYVSPLSRFWIEYRRHSLTVRDETETENDSKAEAQEGTTTTEGVDRSELIEDSRVFCVGCGAAIEAGWNNCLRCGAKRQTASTI